MSVQVARRPYFRAVTAAAGKDRAAWEKALDLWALALARVLSLTPEAAWPDGEEEPPGGAHR
ncbi:MAG TPA: hypothetical protein VIL07_08555 [Symbiobacteriaceae bacterium]